MADPTSETVAEDATLIPELTSERVAAVFTPVSAIVMVLSIIYAPSAVYVVAWIPVVPPVVRE